LEGKAPFLRRGNLVQALDSHELVELTIPRQNDNTKRSMIERREYVVAAVQADVSSEGCVNGIHFEVENSPVDTRRRREEEEVKVEQEESTVYKAFVTRGNKPVICFYVKVCHPVKSIELFQRPDSE